MIEHQVEQGSAAWFALRIGIPTASEFEKIVTPTGKPSAQSRKYAFRLIAEALLNRPLDSLDHLEWVARGKELEPDAVRMYEFEQGLRTRKVGFVTTDDGRIGASPDRLLIGVPGAVEVKCPAPNTHLEYMLDGFGLDYRVQVQGQLMVAELEWVDRYSYHPDLPPVRVRTHREEEFIAKLRGALDAFCDMRDVLLDRARAAGVFQAAAEVRTPHDLAQEPADAQEEAVF